MYIRITQETVEGTTGMIANPDELNEIARKLDMDLTDKELDAQNMSQLIGMVDRQMNYYNEVRRHSSIGQVSPLTYIEQVGTKREGA